jgi:hypothetical protein
MLIITNKAIERAKENAKAIALATEISNRSYKVIYNKGFVGNLKRKANRAMSAINKRVAQRLRSYAQTGATKKIAYKVKKHPIDPTRLKALKFWGAYSNCGFIIMPDSYVNVIFFCDLATRLQKRFTKRMPKHTKHALNARIAFARYASDKAYNKTFPNFPINSKRFTRVS